MKIVDLLSKLIVCANRPEKNFSINLSTTYTLSKAEKVGNQHLSEYIYIKHDRNESSQNNG